MLRLILGTFAVLSLCAASMLAAAEKDTKDTTKDAKKAVKATITKVDSKAGTVTVKMKDKDGKEVEKKFKLAEDIHYFDSTGKAVVIDFFQSGNQVLVIEQQGVLKEIRQDKSDKKPEK